MPLPLASDPLLVHWFDEHAGVWNYEVLLLRPLLLSSFPPFLLCSSPIRRLAHRPYEWHAQDAAAPSLYCVGEMGDDVLVRLDDAAHVLQVVMPLPTSLSL